MSVSAFGHESKHNISADDQSSLTTSSSNSTFSSSSSSSSLSSLPVTSASSRSRPYPHPASTVAPSSLATSTSSPSNSSSSTAPLLMSVPSAPSLVNSPRLASPPAPALPAPSPVADPLGSLSAATGVFGGSASAPASASSVTSASYAGTSTASSSTLSAASATTASTDAHIGRSSTATLLGVRRVREEKEDTSDDRDSSGLLKKAKSANYGMLLLMNQFKSLVRSPPDGISVGLVNDDDVYVWKIMMEGPEGTLFEGGYFPCTLTFPKDFPFRPPQMTFTTPGFWHPNVFRDGKVCISILHEAVEDRFNSAEPMSEKWRPVLGVEQVLISVRSMLSEPNCDSPANVDASVQYKTDPAAYKKAVREVVRRSVDQL